MGKSSPNNHLKYKQVKFDKALKFLDGILSGKGNKTAAHDAGLGPTQISAARRMFPLFTGFLEVPSRGRRKPTE